MTAANRAADEVHLAVLARAMAGEPLNAISASLGKTAPFASMAISRIRAADLAESGEPPERVLAAYPPMRSNPEKGKS